MQLYVACIIVTFHATLYKVLMCICARLCKCPERPVHSSQKQVGFYSTLSLQTQRLMRAGGTEAPPDFDLTVGLKHMHACHYTHWSVHARANAEKLLHVLCLPLY